jgi:hypothetical protein
MKIAALAIFLGLSASAAAQGDFPGRILALHNAERTALGLPPLAWSDTMAAQAAVWANRLAELGVFGHSPQEIRPGQGENLWMGTAGAFTLEEMVGGWSSEKRLYHYGRFPDVGGSGEWHVVGHYTQMIWRDTSEVGCALVRGNGADYLVCRYSPPGNVYGEWPY